MNARTPFLLALVLGTPPVFADPAHESFGLDKLLEKVPVVAEQIRTGDDAALTPSLLEYRANRALKPLSSEPPIQKGEDPPINWKQMRETAFQAMGIGENREAIEKPIAPVPAKDPLEIPRKFYVSASQRLVAAALTPSPAEARYLKGAPQLSSLARKGFASPAAVSSLRPHKAARPGHSSSQSVGYAIVQE